MPTSRCIRGRLSDRTVVMNTQADRLQRAFGQMERMHLFVYDQSQRMARIPLPHGKKT